MLSYSLTATLSDIMTEQRPDFFTSYTAVDRI